MVADAGVKACGKTDAVEGVDWEAVVVSVVDVDADEEGVSGEGLEETGARRRCARADAAIPIASQVCTEGESARG